MSIPDWVDHHRLPTVRPETPERQQHQSWNRSPYEASIGEFIRRFAVSPPRVALLQNLLDYRSDIYQAGIKEGFQWINGSFVEDIENKGEDGRPPNDIDVVTFYYPPQTECDSYLDLFDTVLTKPKYNIDAYPIQLGEPLDEDVAKEIGYWAIFWSQQRGADSLKGFVKVNLNPEGDSHARRHLIT